MINPTDLSKLGMPKQVFYPNQEPSAELNSYVEDLEWSISDRITDLMRDGIFPAKEMYDHFNHTGFTAREARFVGMTDFEITDAGGLYVSVGQGLAYDVYGNRIFVSSADGNYDNTAGKTDSVYRVDAWSNDIPTSTGRQNILLEDNKDSYIYVRYLKRVDTISTTVPGPNVADPDSSTISYTHWLDGYEIVIEAVANGATAPAAPDASVFLGMVAITGGVQTAASYTGRKYIRLNPKFVESLIGPTSADYTAAADYGLNKSVTLDQHINAIGAETPTNNNPHGTGVTDIPGLSAMFGMYNNYPTNFHSAGLVNITQIPSYAAFEARAVSATSVVVTKPTVDDFIVFRATMIDSLSQTFANLLNSDGSVVSSGNWTVDFTAAVDGYYYVALYYDTATLTIPAAKAVSILIASAGTVGDMINNPEAYASELAEPKGVYIPLALVYKSSGSLQTTAMTDPHTGLSAYALDIRPFGLIRPGDSLACVKRYVSGVSSMDISVFSNALHANPIFTAYSNNAVLAAIRVQPKFNLGAFSSARTYALYADDGDIHTNKAVSASTTVTAGTGMTATAGDVEASVGAVKAGGASAPVQVRPYVGATTFTSYVPAGAMMQWIGVAAPTGFTLIDGSTIANAQTLYPDLWAVAPASWKSGANLVLPDWRGLMPMNVSAAHALLTTGGAETHTLSGAELPDHTHTDTHNNNYNVGSGGGFYAYPTGSSETGTPNSVGTGAAFGILPPYVAVNWILKLMS